MCSWSRVCRVRPISAWPGGRGAPLLPALPLEGLVAGLRLQRDAEDGLAGPGHGASPGCRRPRPPRPPARRGSPAASSSKETRPAPPAPESSVSAVPSSVRTTTSTSVQRDLEPLVDRRAQRGGQHERGGQQRHRQRDRDAQGQRPARVSPELRSQQVEQDRAGAHQRCRSSFPAWSTWTSVGQVGHRRVVGDQHHRLAELRHRLPEHVQQALGALGVEGAGGLVGEDDRRLGEQRPGDGDALLLAAGQLLGRVVEPVADAEPLGQARPAGPGRPLARPAAAAGRCCRWRTGRGSG